MISEPSTKQQKYSSLLFSFDHITLVFDQAGLLLDLVLGDQNNRNFEEFSGCKINDLFDRELAKLFKAQNALLGEKRQTTRFEYQWVEGDSSRIFAVTLNAMRIPKPCTVCTMLDVTVHRQRELELESSLNNLKTSEERLLMVLEGANEAYWDCDLRTQEVFYNARYFTMLGYDPAKMKQSIDTWLGLMHPDDKARILELQDEAIKANRDFQGEFRMRAADGAYRWILAKGKVVARDHEGTAIRVAGTHADITVQKEAEHKLRKSERRLRLALKAGGIGFWEWNLKEETLKADEHVYDIFGQDPKRFHLTPDKFVSLLHPDDVERVRERLADAIERGVPYEVEYRIIRPDGAIRVVAVKSLLTYDESHHPLEMIGTAVDITKQKKIESELKESESRFRFFSDTAEEGLLIHDNFDFIDCNRSFTDMLGYTKEEMMGRNISFMLAPSYLPEIRERMEKGYDAPVEVQGIRKDGTSTNMTVYGKPITYKGRKVRAAVLTDINYRKEAELKLLKTVTALKDYKLSLDKHSLVSITDAQGKIIYVNDKFCEVSKYDHYELVGKDHSLFSLEGDPNFFRDMLTTIYRGESWQGKIKNKAKDGSHFWVEATIVPFFDGDQLEQFVGIMTDITDLVYTEKALRENTNLLELAIGGGHIGVWIWNYQDDSYSFNLEWLEILGYQLGELETTRETYEQLVYPNDLEELNSAIKRHIQKKTPFFELDIRMRSKDGAWKWIKNRGKVIEWDEQGEVKRLAGTHLDITDHVTTQERIIATILDTEDKERRRIAKELHDSLGQYLTSAALNFDAIKMELKNLDDGVAVKFDTAMGYLQQAITESRTIAHNLMPKVIHDFGLTLAIESLIGGLDQDVSDLNISFYHNLEDTRLNEQIELGLYRITQQALNNVIRHGEAKNIDIQLIKDTFMVTLSIEDDGKGIAEEVLNNRSEHFGLSSMENRAKAMSGSITIESSHELGTIINVCVPLN